MAKVMYTNAVYFPNNCIYEGNTPGLLNYSCVNHVYYAYANVADDGGVSVSSDILLGEPRFRPLVADSPLYPGTDALYLYSSATSGPTPRLR